MSLNCWTERPVNDLKSTGFPDNLLYDNKGKDMLHTIDGNRVYFG